MRHRVHGRKLGRTSAHRKAMTRNQLIALFTHERIITTVAKAKNLRPQAERMVTLARTGTLANRRRILTMVPDKEVVKRLFDEIAPRFAERPGGYTRILRLGNRRGDNAELAIIEFIDYKLTHKGDEGGEKKASLIDRAKGMFGGGRKDDAAKEAAPAEAELSAEETPVEADEPEAVVKEAAAEVEEVAEVAEPEEPEVEAAEEPEAESAPAEEAPAEEAVAEEEPAEEAAEEEKKED